MNPITSSIKNLFSRKKSITGKPADEIGWHTIGYGGVGAYRYYKENQYENGYASITKIANEALAAKPYAINAKGEKVNDVPAVNALMRPNVDMSGATFREALAVMALVHPEVNILVWRKDGTTVAPGGDITADNIAGYTFLEGAVRTTVDGKTTFTLNGHTYDETEVMTIKSVNPYALDKGYSPSQAAARWTRLDDYIADYQRGFFENGAVPAGMFKIYAKTKTEYDDIVDKMQQKHKGADKNNNVTYSHAPINPTDGKPLGISQVEWIPFSSNNKDMALKDIFTQVNKKIDSVYGVPASIRGVNDSNTYASVRVDEQIFIKYTVKPFLLKLWDGFNHELNRITGGIGAAIDFDLVIPGVADEEDMQAARRSKDATTLNLLSPSYTFESIVEYLETGDISKLVKLTEVVTETTTDDEEEVVIDEGATEDAPDPTVLETGKSVVVKKLTDEQRATYESRIADVQRRQMEKQVDRAVQDTSKAVGYPEDEEIETYTAEMLGIILPLMYQEGVIQYAAGEFLVVQAGIDASALTTYYIAPEQVERYRKYLQVVGKSYATETAQSIREVLERSIEQGLTKQQTAQQLQAIMQTDEWRVKRIAVTETNRAGSQASIYAMEQIQTETGIRIQKVWNNSSAEPCAYCKALHGTEVPVSGTFAAEGAEIVGTDGSVMVNNFVSMEVTSAHSNCHCYATYRVVR